jgi:hypothetical protein
LQGLVIGRDIDRDDSDRSYNYSRNRIFAPLNNQLDCCSLCSRSCSGLVEEEKVLTLCILLAYSLALTLSSETVQNIHDPKTAFQAAVKSKFTEDG